MPPDNNRGLFHALPKLRHNHRRFFVAGDFRGATLKSTIVKRSIAVGGHRTSVSLEDAFWSALRQIAHGRRMTLGELVENIDANRKEGNLSSAIRLFVLKVYQDQIAPQHALKPEGGAFKLVG